MLSTPHIMMNKKRIIVSTLLFVLLLAGIHVTWLITLESSQHVRVTKGVADLRGMKLDNKHTVYLDGQWEFYPDALISNEDEIRQFQGQSSYVQVPGDWREGWRQHKSNSYGYGTYRLRVLVDQPVNQPYTFWIREIQAATVFLTNGQIEAELGVVSTNKELYRPERASFTVSHEIKAEGQGAIEVLLQVSNFDDPFKGGIARSIRFGTQAAVEFQRWYSIGFQLVTFIILMLHGLYAVILFCFNPREKTFIIFGLLMTMTGILVIADNDSILLLWLPINYTWALRIKILAYLWHACFMMIMGRNFSEFTRRGKLFYGYMGFLVLFTIFVLVAPAPYIFFTTAYKIFSVLYLFPIIWLSSLIVQMVYQNRREAYILLLAAVSVMSGITWSIFIYNGTKNMIYYPINIIASIVGFSAYWFKRYFRNAEENARLYEQLREADEKKDLFLANTSHELRTPLHGVINIAQSVVAREKQRMDEKSREDMELLITISRRMSHTINDLLDLAQLREGKVILQCSPLRVQSAVSGVLDMLRFMMEGKPIQLVMAIPETFPPVIADEKRLVQVLSNLVHNAIKFTDEGSITISAEVREGLAYISVADTGIGMTKELQERAFHAYEQGTADTTASAGGIGLGLRICEQMVQLHGGVLEVESQLGKGSVFSFTLQLAEPGTIPLVQEENPVEAIVSTQAARDMNMISDELHVVQQQTASTLYKPMILIVDDDRVNLKILGDILSADQYEVVRATSGKEALSKLDTAQWDLIISDVMMPHMSGYELTRLIRERFSILELPILILTARSNAEDIHSGFMAGANDYVTKPVDAMELRSRVHALTELKRAVNERLRMEAAYLQAQIQPHFLFNTLNTITALSDFDTNKMNDLIEAFSSYLRISFDFLNSSKLVPIEHELDLVRSYLFIEHARFEDRIQVVWELNYSIQAMIPPLTIQPLVENAIRHGVLSRARGGTVWIRIVQDGQCVQVEIRDDGVGMDAQRVDSLLEFHGIEKRGIGLLNTDRRLKQLYGTGLLIRSKVNEGTSVSFVIVK
ncbi:ATP-binding protein [Paenibacillus sp. S-12]|uniref:ATP-binding protein n=1 Tax=Paenibacillus sp. S-12 TaxID=3031371 RepID=UPI00338E9DF7